MRISGISAVLAAMAAAFVLPVHADYGSSPKCKQIEAAIAKSRQLAEFAKHNMRPDQAANAMVNSNRRITKYRQEYHDLGCDGSIPKAVQEQAQRQPAAPATENMPAGGNAAMARQPDSRAVCVAQCKQYTSRSDEECFDTCWSK